MHPQPSSHRLVLADLVMQGPVANDSFAYSHVFDMYYIPSRPVLQERDRQEKETARHTVLYRFINAIHSADIPATLLPPRSPQPILDNRTATPQTVRIFPMYLNA